MDELKNKISLRRNICAVFPQLYYYHVNTFYFFLFKLKMNLK